MMGIDPITFQRKEQMQNIGLICPQLWSKFAGFHEKNS